MARTRGRVAAGKATPPTTPTAAGAAAAKKKKATGKSADDAAKSVAGTPEKSKKGAVGKAKAKKAGTGAKLAGKVVKPTKRKGSSTKITKADIARDMQKAREQNLQPVMSDSSDSEDEAEPVKTKKRKRKAPKKAITVEETTTEVKKLSNRAKKALRRESKRARQNKEEDATPTTVYVGHLPFGFFEDQLRGFLEQFGDILKLRMSRSRSSGKSKGYAFILFKHKVVADIVVEALDGYLMYGRILKCEIIPDEKVHPDLYKGANTKYRLVPHRAIARDRHNKPRDEKAHKQVVDKLLRKESAKRKKFKELGIKYDFPGYAACR